MKAILIREHGSYDKLRVEDVPDPEPKPNEVLIRVKAAGLNHLDLWVRRGVPGHTFPLPMIPGSDGAGVVQAIGSTVTVTLHGTGSSSAVAALATAAVVITVRLVALRMGWRAPSPARVGQTSS